MKMIRKIARVCFWISVVLGVLGQFITFYPGAEMDWFALAAILSLPGFLIPKWSFRAASLAMLVLWSTIAVSGYTRGKEYQQWLTENPPEKRIRELEEQIKLMESNSNETMNAAQNNVLENIGTNAPNSQH